MYSRNYGGSGIQSEGQLYNMQNNMASEQFAPSAGQAAEASASSDEERHDDDSVPAFALGRDREYRDSPHEHRPSRKKDDGSIFDKFRGIFSRFEIDDLILIAIGILLLLDGDCDNDILVVFVLALLFL